MSVNPISLRYPFELRDQPPEVVQAHRYAFQGLVDVNQAIAALKGQITTLQTSSGTGTGTSTSTTTEIITNTINDILSGLGMVNDQTGVTAYTTQTSDAGALLILNDASPVAVSLNSVVTTPYALFITNFGAGTATLTPTTGTINGGGSLALLQGQLIWVVFDGTNWETGAFTTPPQTITAVATKFLISYDAATGAFVAAQPAFTDISGTATTAQIGTGIPAAAKYVDGAAGAWTSLPAPILSGTSSAIGGSALLAGQVVTTTVTVTGATTSMTAVCSPVTYPGDGSAWDAYVSAADTVTVRLSAIIALTPTSSTYNVRVIP